MNPNSVLHGILNDATSELLKAFPGPDTLVSVEVQADLFSREGQGRARLRQGEVGERKVKIRCYVGTSHKIAHTQWYDSLEEAVAEALTWS